MSPTPADCRKVAVPQHTYVTTRAVTRWLDRNGVSLRRAFDVLQDPYEVHELPNGYTRHIGPGYEVILGSDQVTILAVRPLVPIGTSARQPRMSGVKSDQRATLPQDIRPYLAHLRHLGFCTELAKGGHWKITHPDHPGRSVTMAATPSDHRWPANTARVIRSVFDIDIRDH